MDTTKPKKPPIFTGKDNSLAAINAWIFRIRVYVETSDLTPERQTKIAATYLGDTAEKWFIAKYGRATALPELDEFLTKLKERFALAEPTCAECTLMKEVCGCQSQTYHSRIGEIAKALTKGH